MAKKARRKLAVEARRRHHTREQVAVAAKKKLRKLWAAHRLNVKAGGKNTLRIAASVIYEFRQNKRIPERASLDLAEKSLTGLIGQMEALREAAKNFRLAAEIAEKPELADGHIRRILAIVEPYDGLRAAYRVLAAIEAEKRRFGLQMPKALESTESRPVEH
ncbi:MAG: hypothetical protein WC634_03230 [archaeon]